MHQPTRKRLEWHVTHPTRWPHLQVCEFQLIKPFLPQLGLDHELTLFSLSDLFIPWYKCNSKLRVDDEDETKRGIASTLQALSECPHLLSYQCSIPEFGITPSKPWRRRWDSVKSWSSRSEHLLLDLGIFSLDVLTSRLYGQALSIRRSNTRVQTDETPGRSCRRTRHTGPQSRAYMGFSWDFYRWKGSSWIISDVIWFFSIDMCPAKTGVT